MINKNGENDKQNDNKQEYIIYLNLLNKYNNKFKMCTTWFEKLKLQKDLINDEDYKRLTKERQDELYKSLMERKY